MKFKLLQGNDRLKGLIGRLDLCPTFFQCDNNRKGVSLHTFGCLTAMDMLFLDEQGKVLQSFIGVKPYKYVHCKRKGIKYVLELPAYTGLGIKQVKIAKSFYS